MAEDNSKKQSDTPHERLDTIREQLYARGTQDPNLGYTDLSKRKTAIPENTPSVWRDVRDEAVARHTETVLPRPVLPQDTDNTLQFAMPKRKRTRFRIIAIAGGAIFFLIAVLLASTYLFFGKNSISGNNITLEARGPFTVGGGEKFDFTISLTNQNAVPIAAATLIIEYPQGTQSASEQGKEQFRERRTIERIGPGEVLNIPASAVVFGEENEEKEIRVTIEYRVEGSNATFFRDAPPLKFKISSSPVSMSVDAVERVTSGQEIDLTVQLTSNSPTTLEGLLMKAEYPPGFSFTSSEPRTVAGEDAWRIAELKPEEKKTIRIRGLMSGKDPEKKIFKFTSGVANERDPFALASVFTTKNHELELEAAFVNLEMTVNGKGGETVTLAAREAALIDVTFRNTLSDTIYDAVIEVELTGNALDKPTVSAGTGFYDSTKSIITWDSIGGNNGLREIIPGGASTVSFSFTPLAPDEHTRTPQVIASVNVKGRRVSESNVAQTLTGTIARTVKIESQTTLSSQAFYTTGPFENSGPVPPVAEQRTTYTIFAALANGSNPLSDTVVEMQLPPYMSWEEKTQASIGALTYNASTRLISWKIGDLEAGKAAGAAYQVSLMPSITQVGTVPAIVTEQRSRAKDRFTGTVLRATTPDLPAQLDFEPDESKRDGRVQVKNN